MTDKGPVHISNYYVFMVAIASGPDSFGLEEVSIFQEVCV